MSRLAEADALMICVPTPLSASRDPDLQYIESTAEAIAAVLRPGQLVILESTTYPTTTRDVMVPILNRNPSGLVCSRDVFVAFSPEREDPGNPDYTAAGIPKVVGGIDDQSGELACALYAHAIVKVIRVANAEIAEACKILENTYRAVNIALVNELKTLFDRMGIDIWQVVDAAKTKPFGFQAFYPGPGLGGHCIPIDPFYLSWLARMQGMNTRFIELAGEVNAGMPRYVISRLSEFLNDQGKPIKGSRICLLGMAYKKDVDDPRESPSFELMELLMERGAILTYSDPHVPRLPKMRHYHLPPMSSTELTAEFLGISGLCPDFDGPHRIRLRTHREAFAHGARYAQCNERCRCWSRKDLQSITLTVASSGLVSSQCPCGSCRQANWLADFDLSGEDDTAELLDVPGISSPDRWIEIPQTNRRTGFRLLQNRYAEGGFAFDNAGTASVEPGRLISGVAVFAAGIIEFRCQQCRINHLLTSPDAPVQKQN